MKYQLVILGKSCVQKSLMHTYLTYIHPSNIANLQLVGMLKWLDTCVYLWALICKQAEFEITWITSWYTSSMSSHRWLSYRIYHCEIHPFLPFSQMMIQGMRWKQSSKYRHLSHTVVAYHIMVRVQYSTLLLIPYASFIKKTTHTFLFSILMQ